MKDSMVTIMKRTSLILLVLSLLILFPSTGVYSYKDTINSAHNPLQAPPINKVKIVYVSGGNPVLEKANLSTFLNEILEPFDLEETLKITTYEPLENATVLLLLGLRSFGDVKIEVITQFLLDGGSLLIALPDENYTMYNDLLKLFSLKVLGPIYDNETFYKETENVVVNSSYLLNEHPLARSLFGNVSKLVIPKGIGLEKINATPLINATFTEYSLAWGTNTTFIDKNKNEKYDKDEPRGKNVSLITVIELWYGGKIVILPSVYMLSNTFLMLLQYDDYIFIKALMYWLGNQIAYISIRNIKVEPTIVDLNSNPRINVTFMVTDENNNTIPRLDVYVFLVRLGSILINASAQRVDNTTLYKATLDVTGLRWGTVIVYIMAYKKYYGYHWAGNIKVILYKQPVKKKAPDIILLTLGIIVPTIISLILIIYVFPEYRQRTRKLKEIEKKAMK